jgi:hypothetical protein
VFDNEIGREASCKTKKVNAGCSISLLYILIASLEIISSCGAPEHCLPSTFGSLFCTCLLPSAIGASYICLSCSSLREGNGPIQRSPELLSQELFSSTLLVSDIGRLGYDLVSFL